MPDTSRVAALQVAHELKIVYREGFVKNRYVGRTFIMPGQQMRKKSVRRKLNAMALEFANKNVLLVDGVELVITIDPSCYRPAYTYRIYNSHVDSIVRGTTSKEIVQMARDAGAKKVYFASCSPAIRYSKFGVIMRMIRY